MTQSDSQEPPMPMDFPAMLRQREQFRMAANHWRAEHDNQVRATRDYRDRAEVLERKLAEALATACINCGTAND